ncbi:hypothetical protein HZQ19_14175 [Elizabethkingia anophelis]|nr:hypothetical protein [Elizabethkingia anophelis]MCT4003006.1 hypothetical protein [Elizabethkingia anophelis]MCT4017025.1 hypothetical protein [Elizabethkingia anophelis]MCT4020587.1 hypothetical protein [Elizabethkingia anophelis]
MARKIPCCFYYKGVYLKGFTQSSGSYKFLHKDYLGSILAVSDEEGNLLQEAHFDAWGQLTAGSVSLLDRGYTSHEHFEDIGIIHMNGRLYDPLLRRFLNADEIDEGDSPIPLKSIDNERGKIFRIHTILRFIINMGM